MRGNPQEAQKQKSTKGISGGRNNYEILFHVVKYIFNLCDEGRQSRKEVLPGLTFDT